MPRLIARLSADERTAFIAAARSLVGVPFKHQGRDEKGIDCLGVVHYALTSIGRTPLDYRKYERDPRSDAGRLRAELVNHFGHPVSDLRPGYVVSMHWHGVPNHVAIVADYYLGGLSLIHALHIDQAVIETRLAEKWPRRILEAWRP